MYNIFSFMIFFLTFYLIYDIIYRERRYLMTSNMKSVLINRIEKIANKVYRGNKNALYMLVNDLEEFFEMNGNSDVDKMTTEEFDRYIKNICKENERM